jgi:hypothetical protein
MSFKPYPDCKDHISLNLKTTGENAEEAMKEL